jgi:hypothetical protein
MQLPETKAQPSRQGFGARKLERDQADRERVIKPRKGGAPSRGYISWLLTVPAPVWRDALEAGHGELSEYEFLCELTPEGILFRVVGRTTPTQGWPE